MAPPAKNAHVPATSTADDVQTLRRLTREAFGEITSLRDRLGDLERSVATDRASRVTDAARVDARVTMGGVALGGRRAAAAAADVDVAPRAVTTIDAPLPGGDSLVVRLASSSSSSSSSDADPTTVALEKVMYRHRIGSRGWLRISPIGGEGQDAAATLNPLSKGGALTSFGARGSSTLSRCEGAAACASYDFGDGLFGVSGGVFDRDGDDGEGDDGESGSENGESGGGKTKTRTRRALLQATARPGTRAAVSLAAAASSPSPSPSSSSSFELGVNGLFAVGDETLVAAWASSGGGDWGVAATRPPGEDGGSPGWGVAFGVADEGSDRAKSDLRCEAFARLGGESRRVTPGVVARRDGVTGKWCASFACKVDLLYSS
jgi:hypothetical protein